MIYLRFFIIGFLFTILNGDVLFSQIADREFPIKIEAQPISNFDRDDAARHVFGDLEFRGGMVLTSSEKNFGGFSAIRIQPDGVHFLALSDRAYWLRGSIVYADDRPTGIKDAVMGPVLDSDGKHAAQWDTESIAIEGSRLYMGVEGLDRILCFFHDAEKFPVLRDSIPFPPGATDFPQNRGLEAVEFTKTKDFPNGALVALSEKALDKNGNLLAYLIEGPDRKTFTVKRSLEYDIADAASLPDGDLLIMERKYDFTNGAAMRIRRLPIEAIRPASVVDGPTLIEADMQCEVDNMEALAVHRDASGRIVLTLMSDNNQSPIQRTLLLQFILR